MSPGCPSFDAISRRSSGEEVPAIAAHLLSCARCANTLAALRSLQEAAHGMEEPSPPPGWAERVERELRAQGSGARPRAPLRSWVAGAAALAAAAAAGGFVVQLLARPEGTFAHVVASPDARVRHLTVHPLAGEPVVERVELESGEVSLEVAHLRAGERVIVATRDAEVEVRGTAFDVAAEAGRLRSVVVRKGLVEVRHRASPPVWLSAGAHWVPPALAPAPAAAAPPGEELSAGPTQPIASAISPPTPGVPASPVRRAPARVAPEPPAPATSPEPPRPGSPAEQAFAEGWEALTSGKPGRAADCFARAGDGAGDAGLREDARYWRIVALQRLGESAAATREASVFLESWPESLRAGELSLLVGAERLAAGDRAGARRLLERAAQDPSPSVRQRAREGLEALAPLR